MKTSKNKLIALLAAVTSLFVASTAMAGGKNGSGGGSRANQSTQGQSQKSQSQQSQQSESKHLDTQQTNQNSQSQKWTTGSCGQYRVFRMDPAVQVVNPGGAGLFQRAAGGSTPTITKVGGAGGINKAPGAGLFEGQAGGTTPTIPTKVGGLGGINAAPVFGGGTGTGATGTSGTGTGGTGTGMPSGGMGGGGTLPSRPHPGGGYPVSNGGTYTAYRVDTDAEPALPANAAPPVLVRIMNPAATNLPISFIINGQVVQLQAGEAGEFRLDGSGLVKFDRGGKFGECSYTLKQGDYRFEPTAKGWDLYEQSAAATQTGGLPRNALPGEGSK